ncbi:right-handed parallel beta-helix repeat-containing protein [Candidatus Pacearchaeota archaeon]|nr:right-handed parallel beta-helix repeat-containing protein [Candidatus Pacearchaeota archaeon]
MRKTLIAIVSVLFILSLLVSVDAASSRIKLKSLTSSSSIPGNINSCQTLDKSGTYILTKNLVDGEVSSGCFKITTSNVDLNCNGFSIRNTLLNGPAVTASGVNNITVRNCNIRMNSVAGTGIDFYSVTNSLVNNTVALNNNYGISFSEGSHNRIVNSSVISNINGVVLDAGSTISKSVIMLNQVGVLISDTSNSVLSNNFWSNVRAVRATNDLSGSLVSGNAFSDEESAVYIEGSGLRVINNTFYAENPFTVGVTIPAGSNNLIGNNTFTGLQFGIHLIAGSYNVIDHNVIDHSSSSGIYFEYNPFFTNVTNNIISNSAWRGVDSDDFGKNNSFVNNTVEFSGNDGIYVSYGWISLVNNTLKNNGNYGVNVRGNLILENNIINNNKGGVYLNPPGGYYDFENQIIKGNKIQFNGGLHGIDLEEETSHVRIVNNIVTSNTPYDLYLSGNNQDISVVDNTIGSYNLAGEGNLVEFENTAYGKITFVNQVTESGASLDSDIIIKNNEATINSGKTGFNKASNITLYNLPSDLKDPQIFRNGAVCSESQGCYAFTSLNAGTVKFAAPGNGYYTIGSSIASANNWCNNTDINHDGSVTISDFMDVSSHFNEVGCTASTGWCSNTDINHDGTVSISDFIDVSSAIGKTTCI